MRYQGDLLLIGLIRARTCKARKKQKRARATRPESRDVRRIVLCSGAVHKIAYYVCFRCVNGVWRSMSWQPR